MNKAFSKISLYASKYKWGLILSALICLINSAISILAGDYIKNIIDSILQNQEPVTHLKIIAGVALVISGAVFAFLNTYCSGYLSVHICRDLREQIVDKLQLLPIKTVEESRSGEIISKINYDLPIIQSFFSDTFPSFIYYPVVLVGTALYLAYIDWRLLLITTSLIPLTIYISSNVGKPVRKYAKARSESAAKETATAKDIISGIYISKAFNVQDTVFKKYEAVANELIDNHYLYEKKLAFLTPFSMIIRLVPFFFCFIFGGYFAVNGWISVGSLYAFIFLLNNLVHPMSEIPSFTAQYRTFEASATHVEDILNESEERTDGSIFGNDASTAIEFKDICFSYNSESVVHNKLSFKIPAGKTTAVVGMSGCGKTTILKEICGSCTPQSGSIFLFEKDVKQWSLEGIRGNIALISQDSFLYPSTIMENISYGKIDATLDEIYSAAKTANAHEFIVNLPNGYNTLVGEKGVKLSGGQKQRICIARAVLKGAEILLMDEPTSSLDAQSETLLDDALLSNRDGRTILLIAHRFSTIKGADNILVMDKGAITESGSFAELSSKDGLFKSLYINQYQNQCQQVKV